MNMDKIMIAMLRGTSGAVSFVLLFKSIVGFSVAAPRHLRRRRAAVRHSASCCHGRWRGCVGRIDRSTTPALRPNRSPRRPTQMDYTAGYSSEWWVIWSWFTFAIGCARKKFASRTKSILTRIFDSATFAGSGTLLWGIMDDGVLIR